MKLVFALAAILVVVVPARAQDAVRVQQLEEQVRQLTGRVEELSFQLLQMEERMRKMQEDNEFRFQELEDAAQPSKTNAEPEERGQKRGLGKPEAAGRAADDPAATTATSEPADRPASAGKPSPAEDRKASADRPSPAASARREREETRKKGTLTFDDEGKLVAGPGLEGGKRRAALPKPPDSPFTSPDEAAFAAAAFGSTPDAVFARGRELFRAGKFEESAEAFRAHVGAWPDDGREAEARYWLGESLFRGGAYYEAASALLDAHNRFPDAKTAPDALLALGLSLAGLEQREVACATYAEVLKRYPRAEPRLGEQVRAEQASTRC